jgi:hypothetical protein
MALTDDLPIPRRRLIRRPPPSQPPGAPPYVFDEYVAQRVAARYLAGESTHDLAACELCLEIVGDPT